MADNATQRPRILVIDHDDDGRGLICETLQLYYEDREGVRVVGLATAAQALAQDLEAFDIILLDYNLPDMPGPDLVQEILDRTDVPIIMVTGEHVSAIAAEAVRRGAQDYVIKVGDYLFTIPVLVEKNVQQHHLKKENFRLQLELETMLNELRVKNLQLEESLEKVKTLATTDPLTGLANRRHFAEMLERLYGEAIRYEFDLTCCMCDLDDYKRLNDTLGHQVGDELLVIAAEVIRSSLRSSDIAARYGGDEFLLLLPHTSLDRALSVGGRIRRELGARSLRDARITYRATISMGLASLAADRPASGDALIAMADRALFVAKEQGKDRIVAFSRVAQPPTQ